MPAFVSNRSLQPDPEKTQNSFSLFAASRPKIFVRRLDSLPTQTMRTLTEVELSSLQSLLDQQAGKLCGIDGDVCILKLIESHARPFLDNHNHEERCVRMPIS